jgi:hypothetical protein
MGVNRLDENDIGARRIILGNAVIGAPHNNLGMRLDGKDSVSNAHFAVMVVLPPSCASESGKAGQKSASGKPAWRPASPVRSPFPR